MVSVTTGTTGTTVAGAAVTGTTTAVGAAVTGLGAAIGAAVTGAVVARAVGAGVAAEDRKRRQRCRGRHSEAIIGCLHSCSSSSVLQHRLGTASGRNQARNAGHVFRAVGTPGEDAAEAAEAAEEPPAAAPSAAEGIG